MSDEDDRRGIDKHIKTFLGAVMVLLVGASITGFTQAVSVKNKVDDLGKRADKQDAINLKVIEDHQRLKDIEGDIQDIKQLLYQMDQRERQMQIQLQNKQDRSNNR